MIEATHTNPGLHWQVSSGDLRRLVERSATRGGRERKSRTRPMVLDAQDRGARESAQPPGTGCATRFATCQIWHGSAQSWFGYFNSNLEAAT